MIVLQDIVFAVDRSLRSERLAKWTIRLITASIELIGSGIAIVVAGHLGLAVVFFVFRRLQMLRSWRDR